jgi:acyl dehydratase
MSGRFLEDYVVGEVLKPTPRVSVEKDAIIAFARQFDPQPFHLDEEEGRRSIFRGLVASGWHTAAMTMRLVAESEYRPAGGSIGLGFDALRWPLPVRPGDELHIETEVLEVRTSKSRLDSGLVKLRTRTINQNGEVVQDLTGTALVPRRPADRSGKS